MQRLEIILEIFIQILEKCWGKFYKIYIDFKTQLAENIKIYITVKTYEHFLPFILRIFLKIFVKNVN